MTLNQGKSLPFRCSPRAREVVESTNAYVCKTSFQTFTSALGNNYVAFNIVERALESAPPRFYGAPEIAHWI